ncbi:hypothetical protein E1287_33395 [Actinomadura sp. KC06]|uniref:hypothetical protein n=1 Tax=Actinomadura sp. KC06 TaxID=2530369 RepID=UPI001043AF40|nr:hypothetical protein [Actinomadura sp. KC06]TDD28096.1 hypothetical protein E1287_33395 [Actinomadura sp. KC06]
MPASGTAGAQPKQADPKRIKQHAGDLRSDVIPMIKKAGDTLTKDGNYNLEGGDFSMTCTPMAPACPMAIQFAFEDVKMLMTTAKNYAEKIERAAGIYGQTEEQNKKNAIRR